MVSLDELLDYLLHVKKLPTLPQVAIMLEQSLSQEEPDVHRVSQIIADDPPVTGMVLKVANSVMYGARRSIATVREAVVRLGFSEIRKMVYDLSLVKYLANMPPGNMDPLKFWQHSIGVALCTEVINEITGLLKQDGNRAHVVGLLHDLGRWVTATYMPEVHQQIPESNEGKYAKKSIITLERDRIGLDHAQIGAALLERWGLPMEIVNTVRYHHEPDVCPQIQRKLAFVIYLADHICREIRLGDVGEGTGDMLKESTWKNLGITKQIKKEIVEKVRKKLEYSEVLLTIGEFKKTTSSG